LELNINKTKCFCNFADWKYWEMRFKDVIGQEEIKNNLLKSYYSNRISHAYLFYGIPGVGKKALAWAFAQFLSCQNKQENDSCGVCPSCHKYEKLIHPDFHFVFPVVTVTGKKSISDSFLNEWRQIMLTDPYFSYSDWTSMLVSDKNKSKQANIFVDESTEIINKLNFKSFESDYKIMMIWLPEKMNQQCANKILKTLEEPPFNTVFLMVSDSREDILPTIYSRTQPVKVLGIDDESLKNHLIEKYNISLQEAEDIVKISNGSLIEAKEQIQTSEDNKFNLQQFIALMRLAYKKNINEGFSWVDTMTKINKEKQKNFLYYCTVLLRESFVYNFRNFDIVYLTSEEKEFVEKFSGFIKPDNIESLVKIISDASYHIERNGNEKIIYTDMFFLIMKVFK
jgi:DNA polymerase-3 subunit delta'